MIIVKLMGGLGNQMFQYSFGRRMAEKKGVQLKLDLSLLRDRSPRPDFTYRDYELNIFNIKEAIAKEEEIKKYTAPKPKNLLPRIFYKIKKRFSSQDLVKEKYYHFDNSVFDVSCNSYLEGYWQSEKYFIDIQEIIREEFQFRDLPIGNIAELQNKIKSLNSVSIHIRRGDYVSNKATNAYHGVCSLEYYHKAITFLLDKLDAPHFFIFSDEIEWAKENLIIESPHSFVENDKQVPAYEDMRLMGSCNHHIIANSSFSWWAAWLNDNKNKIVIAPKDWFADTEKNTKDLVPESWIRI
jgi:Glycosyl transferase family 11